MVKLRKIDLVSLMLQENLISINKGEYFLKGMSSSSSKTPVGTHFQGLVNPGQIQELISTIFAQEIEKKNIDEKIDLVCSGYFDTSSIASNIAKKCAIEQLAIPDGSIDDSFGEIRPLSGKKIALIVGVLATGKNTEEMIAKIKSAGGKVTHIFCIFDFGIYPQSKIVEDTVLGEGSNGILYTGLIKPEDLLNGAEKMKIDSLRLKKWLSDNKNLMRSTEREMKFS